MVKDLEPELLRHLAQGSASLLITTKGSPQGELRGQVGRQCGPVGMDQSWVSIAVLFVSHLPSPKPGGGRIAHTPWLVERVKPD